MPIDAFLSRFLCLYSPEPVVSRLTDGERLWEKGALNFIHFNLAPISLIVGARAAH